MTFFFCSEPRLNGKAIKAHLRGDMGWNVPLSILSCVANDLSPISMQKFLGCAAYTSPSNGVGAYTAPPLPAAQSAQ